MTEGTKRFKFGKNFFLGIAFIVLGFVLLERFADNGIDYRELIVLFAVSIVAVIVFGRELGIRAGFVLWVLTLALGYRTVSITKELSIHPSEVLLWLLLVCILFQRELVSKARLAFPVWLWMFIPFCVLAWWPMINGGVSWDRMLNEFRNFLLLIPLMIVASVVLKNERYWRYSMLAFFFASSCIALLGILEYWFPEVARLFPAFMSNAKPGITEDGFMRAQFSFWGGAAATFICVLALPFAIVLAQWWRRGLQRVAIVGASVLQILAIYIGGYRSVWFILLIQVLAACLLRLRKQGAIIALLCLAVFVGGYELVPRTSERVMSGVAVLQGSPIDSSATGRKNRALGALESTIEAPFGRGWSSAGWVHSDFLQVSVNLGVIAGLIFLGGCLYTLVRLGRRLLPNLRSRQYGDLGLSLSLSYVAVIGMLAMEGVTVLPQLVLPVWFVWALAEVWLRQTADVPLLSEGVVTPYPYQFMPVQLPPGLKTDV